MSERDTVDEIAAAVLALGEGTRLHALFPVQSLATTPAQPAEAAPSDTKKPARRTKKAAKSATSDTAGGLSDTLRERLADLRKRGFNRLYQNGNIYEFSTPESLLEIDFRLPVFVLVDRIAVSAENRARIVDAAEIGYRESGEILFEIVPRDLQTLDPQVSAAKPRPPVRPALRFSGAFECKTCHRPYREPEPQPLLLQQSLWRLPPLPGLRQHHRLRPRPHHPRQGQNSGPKAPSIPGTGPNTAPG